MTETPVLRVTDVFVPGGLPTVTYNPRTGLRLEEKVKAYLDERHSILSLTGPTKSGKTVLLKSILGTNGAIWLSGGSIRSSEDFWSAVGDDLGIFPTQGTTTTTGHEKTSGTRISGGLRPGGVGVDAEKTSAKSESTSAAANYTRSRPIVRAASEVLRERKPVVVIDDFHYISAEPQRDIVRGLKDLVFDGLPVILAAVPHRAYDVTRVEKEMTGRVRQLPITFWKPDELTGIAATGFRALNVQDPFDAIAITSAAESFSSPHLMQGFCLEICKVNQIRETSAIRVALAAPDWDPFFRGQAAGTAKVAFDRLARGPSARSDRIVRKLRDGTTTDIYGVVLRAIARTGPLVQLTYEQVRQSLRELMDDPPQKQEVTNVLEQMARIAREQIEGEPVVDYDKELSTLHISDPFFAYYLRWGAGN